MRIRHPFAGRSAGYFQRLFNRKNLQAAQIPAALLGDVLFNVSRPALAISLDLRGNCKCRWRRKICDNFAAELVAATNMNLSSAFVSARDATDCTFPPILSAMLRCADYFWIITLSSLLLYAYTLSNLASRYSENVFFINKNLIHLSSRLYCLVQYASESEPCYFTVMRII